MGCTEKYPYNIQPQKFLQYGYFMFKVRTFYVQRNVKFLPSFVHISQNLGHSPSSSVRIERSPPKGDVAVSNTAWGTSSLLGIYVQCICMLKEERKLNKRFMFVFSMISILGLLVGLSVADDTAHYYDGLTVTYAFDFVVFFQYWIVCSIPIIIHLIFRD